MVCGCNEVVRRRGGKQGCDLCRWSPAVRQADEERGGAACGLDSLGFDSRPASFSAIGPRAGPHPPFLALFYFILFFVWKKYLQLVHAYYYWNQNITFYNDDTSILAILAAGELARG
jgi:hypothetical protein